MKIIKIDGLDREAMNMPSLNEYPQMIYEATENLAAIDREIASTKLSMALQEAKVDESAAFDTSLKNEAQRTARRNTMLGDDYHGQSLSMIAMRHERSLLAAELQRLENGFKVAVLEMRLTIAQLPTPD
jgi:DNA polymerase II large subunit